MFHVLAVPWLLCHTGVPPMETVNLSKLSPLSLSKYTFMVNVSLLVVLGNWMLGDVAGPLLVLKLKFLTLGSP